MIIIIKESDYDNDNDNDSDNDIIIIITIMNVSGAFHQSDTLTFDWLTVVCY